MDTSLYLYLAVTFVCAYGGPSPIVTTKSGQLQGQVIQIPEGAASTAPVQLYQFTGIPFATPPLCRLRFKKTVPLQPWDGVLDATKLPNACKQNSPPFMGGDNGAEDCLYLNIWVPKNTLDAFACNQPGKVPLAVFVYIHGGGFQTGSTKVSTFNATYLAGMNNMIVATIQYRLGSLGFGYLGNDEVPGNMGLWDQLEALKWISENIASFGGDNNQITIGGESAGSVSTSWHLLSPNSRKYFQRAILQSGTAFSPWGRNGPQVALASTNLIFDKVCNRTSQRTLSSWMECLRSADAKQFALNDKSAETQIYEHIFHPVTAGDFLPRDPVAMLLAGDFYKVPLLIGANKDEGTLFVSMSPAGQQLLPGPSNPGRTMDDLTYDDFNTLMYDRNRQLGGETRYPVSPIPLLIEAVKLQYWPRTNGDGVPEGRKVYEAVYEAHGEMGMMCPTFFWANRTAQQVNDVFVYFYTHKHQGPMPGDEPLATHGGELNFMFGQPFTGQFTGQLEFPDGELVGPPSSRESGFPFDRQPSKPMAGQFTEEEKELSRAMMTYWANFIKYGNPNCAGNSGTGLPNWPRHVGSTCREQYFELNEETILPGATRNPVICAVRKPNCLFWQEYMPRLEEQLLGPANRSPNYGRNKNKDIDQ